jgi:hypothetical protein
MVETGSITLKLVLLTVAFSVVLTALLSPAVVAVFRRQVTASMNASASGADDGVHSDPPKRFADAWSGSSSEPVLTDIEDAGDLVSAPATDRLTELADDKLRWIAAAYAAGGVVHAVLTTGFFLATFGVEYMRLAIALPVMLVFALPIVPTVSYVLTARPGARFGWMVAGLVAALLLAGNARGLMITVAKLHLLIPALVFLLFNLRFWRAISPLILVAAASGSLLWLLGLELGRSLVGVDSPAIWLFRLVGFAVGISLAIPALRWIGAMYRAKAIGDQELFLDTWWAVFTVTQTVTFMVRTESSVMLISLVSFPAYWLTKRWVLRYTRVKRAEAAVPLLLLRVFGHARRTEKLLDEITLRWRCVGPIYLISGADLALSHVSPHDFYSFMSGQLSRQFVKDDNDLKERLAALDAMPDPDGRYRINQFFCHRDTWKQTLDGLVAKSAAVLMDLRGFDETKIGCQYELMRLGEHLGEKSIVLMVDRHTDRSLIGTLLRRGSAAGGPRAAEVRRQAYFLAAETTSTRTLRMVTRLLLGAAPGSMANRPATRA